MWTFFGGKHNCVVDGRDDAKELLRLIDSHNFHASEHLRYIDENKAARLAQMQRFMADFVCGHFLLDVYAGMYSDCDWQSEGGKFDIGHVKRAVCHLAWLMEAHETFVNPSRTAWVQRLEWVDAVPNVGASDAAASPSVGDVLEAKGWSKKYWGSSEYWEHEDGQWQYEAPQCADVKTEQLQGVDEFVFVGIWAPSVYHRMKSGVADEMHDDGLQSDPRFMQEACKATVLWPKSVSVTGTAVSLAISKSTVAWPSRQWWMQNVVKDILLANDFGEMSNKNYAGGTWTKPLIPVDDDEREEFHQKLVRWGTTLQEYAQHLKSSRQSTTASTRAAPDAEEAEVQVLAKKQRR